MGWGAAAWGPRRETRGPGIRDAKGACMIRHFVAIVFTAFVLARPALAQAQSAAPPEQAAQPAGPQTPPPSQGQPPAPVTSPSEPAQPAPPPVSQRVYSYPAGCGYPDADGVVVPCAGQWVYTDGYGWIWVPGGTVPTVLDGVPYDYLYTPLYGWTWYVSPWGWGPYFYGAWVVRPWLPLGWHAGWVATPGAFGRLGGHGAFYGRPRAIFGRGAWHATMRGASHGGRR